jgi:two-component system, LytTR family, sensor kinase
MKTRGLVDFYLPTKVALHIKIIIGGTLFSLIWSLFAGQEIFAKQFLFSTLIIIGLMELGVWLGYYFIDIKQLKSGKEYSKKIILRLIAFYATIFAISAILFVLLTLFAYLRHGWDLSTLPKNMIAGSRGWIVGSIIGILIGTLVFFYSQWQVALQNEQKLREEKLVFQYETIRNQVNPHFLFNSLNTLSSLINGNKAAESFINQLSSIYRYVLENHNAETVSLEDEIEFAKNYFALQKIRYEEKIEMDIPSVEMNKYRILPVSLQILIENALKHNSATRDNPLKISISIEDDWITVKNNLQKKMNIESSPGTGLKNLAERLRLITHKEMKIIENKDEFIVKIPLITA